MPEEVKKEEVKKPKGPFGKLKEKVETLRSILPFFQLSFV